jgi:chaperone BCS1
MFSLKAHRYKYCEISSQISLPPWTRALFFFLGDTLEPERYPSSFIMETFRNNSSEESSSIPSLGIPFLDFYLSAFPLVSRYLSTYSHVDISSYLSFVFLLTTVAATLRLRLSTVTDFFDYYFTSCVEIRMDDEMFNYLMFWISRQPFSQKSTSFVAGTRTNSHMIWSSDSDDSDDDSDETGEDIADNFDAYWEKRITLDKIKPLRVTPAEGRHWFWYKYQLISFVRRRQDKKTISWRLPTENLYLKCFGRNPSILKELLLEAQRMYVNRDGNKTIIYRGQRVAEDGHVQHDWVRCMARPPRPLSTVVLDDVQKQAFINDMKEYLHPRTRRWYSNRGIPYRRGYIFYGPPGTGKSSLCFAAAGSLHLKIYLVSLNSTTLTEDGLAGLFQSLPRRCIVLLEDVDAAGMTKKRAEGTAFDAPPEGSVKPPQKAGEGKPNQPPPGISLSALLNIIDGVASSEGRILVMTTNHIEKLDPALLRPGRIDMTIAFGYSDSVTIRDLFLAIYAPLEGDFPAPHTVKENGFADKGERKRTPSRSRTHSSRASSSSSSSSSSISRSRTLTPSTDTFLKADILALAEKFTAQIPSGEFTPAEVQGYLLRHKRGPEAAIEGAEAWIRAIREEKAKTKAAQNVDINRESGTKTVN